LINQELPGGIDITEEVRGLPTYDYQCTSCPCRFELRRSFSEDGPVSCPECGAEAQHVFTPVPIIFKGSGFYTTDYRGNHGHSEPASDTDTTKPTSDIATTKPTVDTDTAKTSGPEKET